jgi:hypothetical protein
MWVNHSLPTLLARRGMDYANVDEADVVDDCEEQAVTLYDVPTSDTRPISDSTTGSIWQVAKMPAYPNMSAEQLATQFGAGDFISQLSTYLGSRSTFSPNLNDRFNAYCQVKVILPPNHYLSNQMRTNRIRTTPAVPR